MNGDDIICNHSNQVLTEAEKKMLARGLRFLYHPKNWVDKKPGSHMPPTRPTWHAFTAYLNISRRIIMCPTHDRRLACEVEMSSTSHASRRLSAKQQKVLKTRHKILKWYQISNGGECFLSNVRSELSACYIKG